MLGMREAYEDWLALGRDLITRGLGRPRLIVAYGARGSSRPSSSAGRRLIASTARFTARGTYSRSCPSASGSGRAGRTGRRSMTRSTSATASND
jgi:hypothetical protein